MAVYKVKGTVTVPANTGFVCATEDDFRAVFFNATGAFGSPAVKNLYQDGFISDYPYIKVEQAGNTSVDGILSITYTLKDEASQDLFFHGDTAYKAETDAYKEGLASYGVILSAEKITEE